MNDVLAGARRGLSPDPSVRARVRQAVDASLAAGPAAQAPAQRPALARPWLSHLLVAGAFAGASLSAGYWMGRRAERRQMRAMQMAPSSPRVDGPPPPVAPASPPPVATFEAAPPALTASPKIERPRRHATESPPRTPAESLALEVRALRNAERALREGHPGLASAFLDDLDRDVPEGKLREERAALRTIARCMAGDQPFGVDLVEDFSQSFPDSTYRARIEQACARTDPAHAGDSSGGR